MRKGEKRVRVCAMRTIGLLLFMIQFVNHLASYSTLSESIEERCSTIHGHTENYSYNCS